MHSPGTGLPSTRRARHHDLVRALAPGRERHRPRWGASGCPPPRSIPRCWLWWARWEKLSPDVVVVLVFGSGPGRFRSWTRTPIRPGTAAGTPAAFQALVAELQSLADQDPDRLADGAWAERVRVLRGLADRVDGHWLAELAGLDARGAAGAEQGVQVGSTAGWLRRRLRMSASTASSLVRTARALYRGPLTATGQAVADGELSVAHAQRAGRRHPGPARPCHRRGRAGAGGGGPPSGPAPAATGHHPSAAGRRS